MCISTFLLRVIKSNRGSWLRRQKRPYPNSLLRSSKVPSAFKQENKELRDELRLKSVVIVRYEEELKRYRSAAFIEEGFEGVRKYHRELVDLLKQGGTYDSYRILEALGIKPEESDLVKAVSSQLEDLEAYGLIETTSKGWKWMK
jgi:hypothetical protein